MSTQTKSKLYLLIIGILLITNIAMLFIFLNKKDDGKRNNRNNDKGAVMKEFLQKEIGFNEQQLQEYDTLNKIHKEKMKVDFETIKSNKEQQFKELGVSGFNDSVIAGMANKSAENQKLMTAKMLNHFAAIRKICTAGQQPKFDSLFYTIWNKKKRPETKK
jgi:hypothetical protein